MTATLPRISIVVPNFNGGKTLEVALRSIIDQGYPNLELIVMDGGSTDSSIEIIKKYEKHIAYWESVSDRGQSHAINKGFARCTGDIVNWLCSDDLLEPGALRTVAEAFGGETGKEMDWCIGQCRMIFPDRPDLHTLMGPTEEQVSRTPIRNEIAQPSCFYRRHLLDRAPPINESFNYAMDQELWCHFLARQAKFAILPEILSIAVQDGANKTRTADYRFYMEADRIFRAYWKSGGMPPIPRWYRLTIRPLAMFLEKHPNGIRAAVARWTIARVGWLQKVRRKWRNGRPMLPLNQ